MELPVGVILDGPLPDPGLPGCCRNGRSKLKTPPVASGGALAGVKVPLSLCASASVPESVSNCW